jgi:glycogen debranching enzyme
LSNDRFEVLAPTETTTLVRGTTVVVSLRNGEIRPHALLGVMFRDERLLSSLTVLVDGVSPPLLASDRTGSSTDRIALLAAHDEYRNGQALLVRRRTVVDGVVTDNLELHSFGPTRTVEVTVIIESDAASILELKLGRSPVTSLEWSSDHKGRAISFRDRVPFAVVSASGDAAMIVDGTSLQLTWKAEMSTEHVWTSSWSVQAAAVTPAVTPAAAPTPANMTSSLLVEGTDARWSRALASSVADLEALTIDLSERGMRFIGAGAPWYQALFGRDSLIAAWQSLPLGPELALDTLDSLAINQGTKTVSRTREAAGKVLHELRIGTPQVFGLDIDETYYGSVDATPLFVMLLAEAYRWGASTDRVRELLPAARAAIQWCRDEATMIGGSNRGPFIWYTPDPQGLGNQGWKDSGDCMVNADGTLAQGSLAVAEAQSYVYEALVGLARLERDLGHGEQVAAELEGAALRLSNVFVEQFCLEDGLIALALDERGAPLRVATSNMGQCLWSGILPNHIAEKVGERMMAPDLLTPWGIRTLGSNERAYNPLGYHLGTVWAHDSAIIAAGLARHGQHKFFRVLTNSLLDAAEQFHWRLPELYGGLHTAGDRAPLPYPAACSPQAWSAGVPLLLLRSALGLQPDVPAGFVKATPAIGTGQRLSVSGIRIGTETGTITVDEHGEVTTTGLTLRITS